MPAACRRPACGPGRLCGAELGSARPPSATVRDPIPVMSENGLIHPRDEAGASDITSSAATSSSLLCKAPRDPTTSVLPRFPPVFAPPIRSLHPQFLPDGLRCRSRLALLLCCQSARSYPLRYPSTSLSLCLDFCLDLLLSLALDYIDPTPHICNLQHFGMRV